MVQEVETGRGAWTKIGKDNNSKYYTKIVGYVVDGSKPDKDVNYRAVNLAVKAIQNRINQLGYKPELKVDGKLGFTTDRGIKWFQKLLNVKQDGVFGPTTAKVMFKAHCLWYGMMNGAPHDVLYGIMLAESGADPGAVGYTTPSDQGLFQINLSVHTDITAEQAFDPDFAADYTAKRLAGAQERFSGKGSDLQRKCTIAQHNSPAQAKKWYETGTPPSEQIETYVSKIETFAKTF